MQNLFIKVTSSGGPGSIGPKLIGLELEQIAVTAKQSLNALKGLHIFINAQLRTKTNSIVKVVCP